MYFYYFLAAIACWLGIQSLLAGRSFAAYVRQETSRPLPDFQPFVSVIAPGRGLEPGLRDNLRALLTQNYPRYEVLFVFDRADDPRSRLSKRSRQARPERSSPVQPQTVDRRFITCELR